MFDKKWILYDNQQWPAQWLDWEVPNHFPKPNLHQKMLWSLFDVLLSVRYTTAFWIPEKPFHLRSMLSKSITCTESCDTCSSLFNRKDPILLHDNARPYVAQHIFQKLNKFGLICHIHLTSHQPTTTSSGILTTFCKENASTTSRRKKMLFKSSSNSKAQIFMLQE